jgi:hypothetical protein
MLWIASRRAAFPGVGYWVGGNLAMCAAGAVHGLTAHSNTTAPAAAFSIGVFLLLAYGLFLAGCRALREQPQPVWAYVACLLWIPLPLWLSTQPELTHLSHTAMRMAYVALLGASIWTLLARHPGYSGPADRWLAFFMALVGAYHLARAFPMLIPEWAHWHGAPHGNQTLVSGFTAVGFASLQLLSLYERAIWALQQAARERLTLADLTAFRDIVENARCPSRWWIAGGFASPTMPSGNCSTCRRPCPCPNAGSGANCSPTRHGAAPCAAWSCNSYTHGTARPAAFSPGSSGSPVAPWRASRSCSRAVTPPMAYSSACTTSACCGNFKAA